LEKQEQQTMELDLGVTSDPENLDGMVRCPIDCTIDLIGKKIHDTDSS